MEKSFTEVIGSEFPKGSVLISVGLPGSWKSPVTEEIAKMKKAPAPPFRPDPPGGS